MRKQSSKLTRTITPDEVRMYQNAGVVLLRGVLDMKTINRLRGAIDDAVRTLGQSPAGYDYTKLTEAYEANDTKTLAAHSAGQHDISRIVGHLRASRKPLLQDAIGGSTRGHFFVDTGTASRIPNIREFSVSGAAAEIAGALLGSDEVRFFGDQMFVKEPGTRERTAFHQDATYFEIDGDQCCVLWVPVDPANAEVGTMQYIRGSHRDGKLYKPNVFVSQAPLPDAEGDDLPDIENYMDEFDVVQFDVEPGDVLVHHYRTIHGAGGNLSRYQVRRALSMRYTGDDIRGKSRPWAPKRLDLKTTVADGEPLSGADFPVVWRRQKDEVAA